jgi:hypothetical protein
MTAGAAAQSSDRELTSDHQVLKPVVALARPASECVAHKENASIIRAIGMLSECQRRYQSVRDYTCRFTKRERIHGQLTPLTVMTMKARTHPRSIYLKFLQPSAGREAIYIAGRHGDKLLAHDVGLTKLIAGTLSLEPTGARAMEECRHPITEAGIGPLLDRLARSWATELKRGESIFVLRDDQPVSSRRCFLIETTHPIPQPDLMFYRVRVFIDPEVGLPIRFEAYDWPRSSDSQVDLVEEYTYGDLKVNVGLRDIDFDTDNPPIPSDGSDPPRFPPQPWASSPATGMPPRMVRHRSGVPSPLFFEPVCPAATRLNKPASGKDFSQTGRGDLGSAGV